MDPHVYISYICFLKNNSKLYKLFWENKQNHTYLNWEILCERAKMFRKIKKQYIYEQEEKWKKFDPQHFMNFLEKYGFER